MSPAPPPAPPRPSPIEFLILHEVYRLGSASPTDLAQTPHIGDSRTYHTVLTYLRRLQDKGFLKARRVGRDLFYTPVQPLEVLLRPAIEEFLDFVIGDSPAGYELLNQILAERVRSGVAAAPLGER